MPASATVGQSEPLASASDTRTPRQRLRAARVAEFHRRRNTHEARAWRAERMARIAAAPWGPR